MSNENLKDEEPSEFLRRLDARRKPGGPPVDPLRLAKYIGGGLGDDERQDVRRLIATYHAWDQAYVEMQLTAAVADPIHALSPADLQDNPEDADVQPRVEGEGRTARWNRGLLLQAASLLLAAGGLGWGLLGFTGQQRAWREVAMLQTEVRKSRMELALNLKEDFVASGGAAVANYWNMSTAPDVLRLPAARGQQEPSPEAKAAALRARELLQEVSQATPPDREATLELAALDIALRQLDSAGGVLRRAAELWPGSPEVLTLGALLRLTQGDKGSIEEAEKLLRQAIVEYPEYLPARYNLALLLEKTGRERESRSAWQEYILRETRAEYRKIAEGYLQTLRND